MFTSQVKLFVVYLLCATAWTIEAIKTDELGPAPKHCSCDKGNTCEVDGYVGSEIIYEDEMVRVWNFTLAPVSRYSSSDSLVQWICTTSHFLTGYFFFFSFNNERVK